MEEKKREGANASVTPVTAGGRVPRRTNFDISMDEWIARLGDDDVAEMMLPTARGTLAQAPENVVVWLENMQPYKGRIRFNEFSCVIELDGRPLEDFEITKASNEAFKRLGFYNKSVVFDGIELTAHKHEYHPVKEYLAGLEWDNVPRVERFFVERLGAPDTPLTREISFKWLMAMLRRVLEPGCYFDHYLIVSDPQQGSGKSKTFERLTEPLGISGATKNSIKPDLGDKDNLMYLNNCIIGLFDESNAIKYSALEAFKTFVSTREYTVRLPYGKMVSTFQTHCVLAATTNEQTFLTDTTSSYERRAWVLLCHGDPDRTPEEWEELNGECTIGQIWAELHHWHTHQADAPWKIEGTAISYLTKENEAELKKIQEGAKTSTDDSAVINALQTILTQKYTKETFNNAYDFQNDHKVWRNENDFRKELEKIPFKWLCSYTNQLAGGKVNRSDKYIRQLITSGQLNSIIGEWRYDYLRYNGTRQACLQVVKRLEAEPDEKGGKPKLSGDTAGIKPAESSPMYRKASMASEDDNYERLEL